MCRTRDRAALLPCSEHPQRRTSPERVVVLPRKSHLPRLQAIRAVGVAAGPPVPRLLRLAALRRLPLAAAELEPAARALPRPVAPLHRGAAAEAALGGRLGAGAWNHASERRKSPGRGVERGRNGRPCGRPENGVLREAR